MLVLTPFLMKIIIVCIGGPLVIVSILCIFVVHFSSKKDLEEDNDIREWPEIKRPAKANQN